MLDKLEKYVSHVGVICISLLFSLMTVQVVLRYGFGYAYFFTEELGRYLLIWATLAGMAVEVRREGHIRITFLQERLPAGLSRMWRIMLDLIILCMFLVLIYTGTDSMLFNHGQESNGLQIPLSIPFLAIPLFFILAAVFILEKFYKNRDYSK